MIDRDTLLSCVRIRCGNVGGSGTVLHSEPDPKTGEYSTYVLTNHHVIEGNVKVDKKWSTLLKRDVKMDILGLVEVHFFRYKWDSRAIGTTVVEADIMTYDKDEDLALLKLRSTEKMPGSVARMYPMNAEKDLKIGVGTVAIGAALGEAPVITKGILSQFGKDIEQREFWIQTGPTIYGNSGGGVFLEEGFEFIGVPARIAVSMSGFSSDAITHLSYMIPITRVYQFFNDQLFRFIGNPKYTEVGESKERESRRKAEELSLARKEDLSSEGEDSGGWTPDETSKFRTVTYRMVDGELVNVGEND